MEVNIERVKMEKYGFVYIWFDKKHKKFYVGRHWGAEDDGYVSSSNNMRMNYKYRPEDFKRRIVKKVYNRDELVVEEQRWLDMIKPEECKIKYYNITLSASTPSNRGMKFTEEHKQKLSKAHKGKILKESTKQKISENSKKQFSDPAQKERVRQQLAEQRANTDFSEKQRKAVTGKVAWNKGKQSSPESIEKMKKSKARNPHKHTEEFKQKARERNLGKTLSAEHREKIRQSLLKRNAA